MFLYIPACRVSFINTCIPLDFHLALLLVGNGWCTRSCNRPGWTEYIKLYSDYLIYLLLCLSFLLASARLKILGLKVPQLKRPIKVLVMISYQPPPISGQVVEQLESLVEEVEVPELEHPAEENTSTISCLHFLFIIIYPSIQFQVSRRLINLKKSLYTKI